MTHELPEYFGIVSGEVVAANDESYRELIAYFLNFYWEHLKNEHWGEQAEFNDKNVLGLTLFFQGLNEAEVNAIWKPFREWVSSQPNKYRIKFTTKTIPARSFWDSKYWLQEDPNFITLDTENHAHFPHAWWYTLTQKEVARFWLDYQSRYIPQEAFSPSHSKDFANTLFDASRHYNFSLHFNKGQAEAPKEVKERGKNTSVNPDIYDSSALLIMATGEQGIYPGVPGHELDEAKAARKAESIAQGMRFIKEKFPHSGSYGNETSYFEQDWQEKFWGSNYPRLLQIKRKYDPDNFFKVHHGVGSEY
jgi:hypothetical protein